MHGEERQRCTVLIPIRSFEHGKSRLGSALGDAERRELVRTMAATMLHATAGIPSVVATNDDEVAAWALENGSESFSPTRAGLDNAVTEGRDLLRARGVERMIVCHADIPGATHLDHLEGGSADFLIVPDLRRDGSNVMSLPTRVPFSFSYGPGSFERHVAEAQRHQLSISIVDDEELAADVDGPDDLE